MPGVSGIEATARITGDGALACQVLGLMEFVTKRTDPSPSKTLTPPGCMLRAAA